MRFFLFVFMFMAAPVLAQNVVYGDQQAEAEFHYLKSKADGTIDAYFHDPVPQVTAPVCTITDRVRLVTREHIATVKAAFAFGQRLEFVFPPGGCTELYEGASSTAPTPANINYYSKPWTEAHP